MVTNALILAKATGEEIAEINVDIDIDLAKSMDFEMEIRLEDAGRYEYGQRIFIPDTEYGGILENLKVVTESNKAVWKGWTWRGLLTQKVVEPPAGLSHLILNGDLNTVLAELVGNRFDDLIKVTDVLAGIPVANWKVDRYVSLYSAIDKLVQSKNCRLQIRYIQPHDLMYGWVELSAVPIKNWSNEIEYTQDGQINFTIEDNRTGINHLVCVGEGQNQERVVKHLYVQKDDTVGNAQFYFGLSERAEVYNASSADAEQLEKDGRKRLNERMNQKKMNVSIDGIDVELGDIVGGRETVTGAYIQKAVSNKILKINGGIPSITYEMEG